MSVGYSYKKSSLNFSRNGSNKFYSWRTKINEVWLKIKNFELKKWKFNIWYRCSNDRVTALSAQAARTTASEPMQLFESRFKIGLCHFVCNFLTSINWTPMWCFHSFPSSTCKAYQISWLSCQNFASKSCSFSYQKEHKTSFSSPFLVTCSATITKSWSLFLGRQLSNYRRHLCEANMSQGQRVQFLPQGQGAIQITETD